MVIEDGSAKDTSSKFKEKKAEVLEKEKPKTPKLVEKTPSSSKLES